MAQHGKSKFDTMMNLGILFFLTQLDETQKMKAVLMFTIFTGYTNLTQNWSCIIAARSDHISHPHHSLVVKSTVPFCLMFIAFLTGLSLCLSNLIKHGWV